MLDNPSVDRHDAQVMTEDEARTIAEALLDLETYVITAVREFDVGWVYFFDSRRHQETGDLRDAIGGNAPILVDRSDGAAHLTGTARSTEEYIDLYRLRDPNNERSWHP